MTTIEEFGVRRFEVLVMLTIGVFLLLIGLVSLYRFDVPCDTSAYGDTACGPSAFGIGILTTSTGVFLLLVAVVWAVTGPRIRRATLPPRTGPK